jgi:FlaA1/EpsC-like NDP-sugar epimerase
VDSIVEQRRDHRSGAPGGTLPPPAEPPPARPPWLRQHLRLLVLLDAVAVTVATLSAKLLSIGPGSEHLVIRGVEVPYNALAVAAVPTWLVVLGMSRSYDIGPFGAGHNEMRRVVSAAAHFLALVAVAYYVVHLERLGRGFLIVIVPLATAFTLLGRFAARGLLHLRRSRGQAVRRAVVMGPRRQARLLAGHLLAHSAAGVVPVAALVPGDSPALPAGGGELPVAGSPDDVRAALAQAGADLLLITGSLAPGELRKLTWQLEGSGVDVLVAPSVGRLTTSQLDVRPVAGLPLLYVDRADLTKL